MLFHQLVQAAGVVVETLPRFLGGGRSTKISSQHMTVDMIEQAQLIFTQINQMEKHIKEPDCKVKCMDFVQHGQNWLWRHKNKTGAFLFMTRIGSPLWGRPTDPFCLELGKQRKTSGLSVWERIGKYLRSLFDCQCDPQYGSHLAVRARARKGGISFWPVEDHIWSSPLDHCSDLVILQRVKGNDKQQVSADHSDYRHCHYLSGFIDFSLTMVYLVWVYGWACLPCQEIPVA